jgi:hypothetical protein
MKTALLTIILMLFPLLSIAYGEWEKLVTSDDGNTYYLNSNRIKVEGNIVRAWIKRIPKKLKPYNGYIVLESLSLAEIDCKSEKIRYLQSTKYTTKGKPITSSLETNWKYPVPDTTEEAIQEHLCAFYYSAPKSRTDSKLKRVTDPELIRKLEEPEEKEKK